MAAIDIGRVTAAISYSHASTALAKAAALVQAGGHIHATDLDGTWIVTSATSPDRRYITTADTCTCPAHTHDGYCKHQFAVLLHQISLLAIRIRTLTT
jgi:hypothetical protein